MRRRTVPLLALLIAVVALAFGSHVASAQGSPTTPVGGGSLKPVTGIEGGAGSSKLGWSWLGVSRTSLPLSWPTFALARDRMPSGQVRQWWAVKVRR